MSDNVIPSMLVYFGVIVLDNCSLPKLQKAFNIPSRDSMLKSPTSVGDTFDKNALRDGPQQSASEAFVLRVAAVDACEKMASIAQTITVDAADSWINTLDPHGLDMWLWSVAKDRADYRMLPRFAELGTVFY
jgi:hypothetical protein